MVARTEAVPLAPRWHWPLQSVFADLGVRYGIKLGLAGLLALFCTQILRLGHSSWAILTVLGMMSSHYVGSLAVKALMRPLGTIGGALLGGGFVGAYASTPAVFLTI